MDSSSVINLIEEPYILPNDERTKDLDLFFANGLYNSCQATDELMKSIEQSQDETLARKALALYQKHYSTLERPWDHVTFMYGLGLIYMHFNAYSWAVKSFREAIYVQPSFSRSRDVHMRLGLIFKATGRYKLSEKHFNLAINDTRPDSGTSSKLELEFHLAHVYELQGKLEQATEAYEKLLQEKDLPQQLSANIHRQLGWINYSTGVHDLAVGSESSKDNNTSIQQQNLSSDLGKMDAALNYLNTSYRTDSDSRTSYYLGRCFTNIGRFQDAFASYRSVIDREESTADTWCSIGVLYHRQNQPTDALQAYIRSVQFDKKHAVAWMNLGILYESHNQFHDALKCYQHVLRSNSNGVDKSLKARIKCIQRHIAEVEISIGNNGKTKINSDKLLSLEDLWNLESKTSSESSGSNSNNNNSNNISNTIIAKTAARSEGIKIITKKPNNQATTIHLLEQSAETCANSNEFNQKTNGPIITIHNKVEVKNSSDTQIANNKIETPEIGSKSGHLSDANLVLPSTTSSNHKTELHNNCKLEITIQGSQDYKPQSIDSKDFCLNQALTNGTSKDSGISSNSSTYADCALVPSHVTDINAANNISAKQVIEAYKNSPKPRKIDVNLLSDEDKPPSMFPRPPPYPPIPTDKLFPSPPGIFLETKKDVTSGKLQDFCQSGPISIVRNIATVLKLDLGLFSTKTLVESNADQPIDTVSHVIYQNTDGLEESITNLWACERQKSPSTISRYACYQVASFRESLQDERDSKIGGSKTTLTKESETDSNESAGANSKKQSSNNNSQANNDLNQNNQTGSNSKTSPVSKKLKKDESRIKYVKSAERIDLSDERKWRPQLNELNKLPHFIKCISASNMLTHIRMAAPEINTIMMSMHVPGCRVLNNNPPNNFCPININVGPGDYEWCAISAEYKRILARLCNRNGFELDDDNWWPRLSDLQKYNVPIYRFSQRPGDLVWVNSGTFYWVQATGWCNSIHWNVGPLCARQYKLASESFEANKLLFRKSDVPMVQMTWNIVININVITDDELYSSIVDVLRRSLRYCLLIKDLLDQCKREISSNNQLGPKSAKFCSLCETEIFNITFNRKLDDSLHCVECARKLDTTFNEYNIKQEYDLSYLIELYDKFIETKKRLQLRQQQQFQQQEQAGS